MDEELDGELKHNPISGNKKGIVQRHSFVESTGAIISLTDLLIGVAAVLFAKNNHQQIHLLGRINLSTVVALLSTVIRALIVAVVEQVISQLKWNSYQRQRPLEQLLLHDRASRGPWGSLILLFKIRNFSIVQIACVVTILSLAITPFSQQAIYTDKCERPAKGPRPTIRVAKSVPPSASQNTYALSKGTIMSSLIDLQQTRPSFLNNCTSGSCYFQANSNNITHSSLGMCSACREITNSIQENASQNLVLPNNLTVYATNHLTNMTVGEMDWFYTKADEEVKRLIPSALNWTILTQTTEGCHISAPELPLQCDSNGQELSSKWNKQNFMAAACFLYPCTKHYYGVVENGRLNEVTISSEPLLQRPLNSFSSYEPLFLRHFIGANCSCMVNGTRRDLTLLPTKLKDSSEPGILVELEGQWWNLSEDCINSVNTEFVSNLWGWLSYNLQGYCSANSLLNSTFENIASPDSDVVCNGLDGGPDHWWLTNIYGQGNVTLNHLARVFEGIANAITDAMRQSASMEAGSQANVYGFMTETVICTHFRWRWMLFPACLLLLAVISLACTMACTRQPIWKDSLLPLLTLSPASSTLEDMKTKSQGLTAIIERNGGRWEFVVNVDTQEDTR
ncbi:hypothetical protein BT63DRAFT_484263 [Microthyrium microscopicum]|uniref:Uncharacterized protein n=1 Tax=Microthyrium microscopicum TaxID=703497 RepID=A0A6A6TXG8_9PEZI|nr:hypothetical protein BT63DRAFT_484263 [Microthyrium microscopicum]